MPTDEQPYNIAAIRQLLLEAFTAEELFGLCQDHPPLHPVVDRVSSRPAKHEMVQQIITYCETRQLFDELLAKVERANPRQYHRYASMLRSPVHPARAENKDVKSERPGLYWQIPATLGGFLLIIAVFVAFVDIMRGYWPPPTEAPEQPSTTTSIAGYTQTSALKITTEETPSPTATKTLTPTATKPPSSTATQSDPDTPTPTPTSQDETWIRPADGMVMLRVPAGEFLMGFSDDDIEGILAQCDDCDREHITDASPQRSVYLDEFWIDKTEVTNAQYRRCVEDGVCNRPKCWDDSDLNRSNQPVVCVSWRDAAEYAKWAGGRLPTEAEWEKAARGTEGWMYPWGNREPDCSSANCGGCLGEAVDVGSYSEWSSPYDALGMAGNVWEWVSDWYAEDYYATIPERNPMGPDTNAADELRVLRGGSWGSSIVYCTSGFRIGRPPEESNKYWGFRCAMPSTSVH